MRHVLLLYSMTFITINFTSFKLLKTKINSALVTSLRSFDPLVKLIYVTRLLLSKISTFLLAIEEYQSTFTVETLEMEKLFLYVQ